MGDTGPGAPKANSGKLNPKGKTAPPCSARLQLGDEPRELRGSHGHEEDGEPGSVVLAGIFDVVVVSQGL